MRLHWNQSSRTNVAPVCKLCISLYTDLVFSKEASPRELIRMSVGSERGERGAAITPGEKKKELRRVYRKLKGVRSQISMKMRELKKEVGETDFSNDDDVNTAPEIDLFPEDDTENDQKQGVKEPEEKARPIATQFELKMLVDHKAKLRKRFKKLLDEAQTNR